MTSRRPTGRPWTGTATASPATTTSARPTPPPAGRDNCGYSGSSATRPGTASWTPSTWARLVAAVYDGEIWSGGWAASDGAPAGLGTIPTTAAKDAWYTAYVNGQRHVTGSTIMIDTSTAPLQVTSPLVLPAGCEIRSA